MKVIGIDPGNVSSGVSFWEHGCCWHHATVRPWADRASEEIPEAWLMSGGRVKVFVEVPQNGTHSSRGGVHFAAGMLVGDLANELDIRRSDVTKVMPREWRALVLEDPRASKEDCVKRAKLYGGPYKSEDEAESVLIGAHGCIELGLDPSMRS